MKYFLPKLKYAFDALEPYIDARTVEFHYSKHHQTYTDKLNAALESHPELESSDLLSMLRYYNLIPEDIRSAVRNNGGGYYNHNLYWDTMIAGGRKSAQMEELILKQWASVEEFKAEYITKATTVFGSGWAWLIKEENNQLAIIQTSNQDVPTKGIHLLAVDVWEHAYYLKYQNRRPEYLDAWWNVIDWEQVYKNHVG